MSDKTLAQASKQEWSKDCEQEQIWDEYSDRCIICGIDREAHNVRVSMLMLRICSLCHMCIMRSDDMLEQRIKIAYKTIDELWYEAGKEGKDVPTQRQMAAVLNAARCTHEDGSSFTGKTVHYWCIRHRLRNKLSASYRRGVMMRPIQREVEVVSEGKGEGEGESRMTQARGRKT